MYVCDCAFNAEDIPFQLTSYILIDRTGAYIHLYVPQIIVISQYIAHVHVCVWGMGVGVDFLELQ